MISFVLKRIGLAALVAATVSIISFLLLHLSGDLAQALAGPSASVEDIAAVRAAYGLDRPLVVQYLGWAAEAARGNFGESFFFKEPVAGIIASRIPVTLTLALAAIVFSVTVAIPAGIIAALRPNSWIDRLAQGVALVGQALPSFWLALMMIILFGVKLGWVPISGNDTWKHYILPAVALGYFALPTFMRLTRAGMIEVLGSDYIRTARAKGLRRFTVVLKHALRNALIPVISVVPVQLGFMLSGSIVIESVFSLNGLGYLGWQSISRADFPVVQAIVLILSVLYVVLTLIADFVNAVLDPRLRGT